MKIAWKSCWIVLLVALALAGCSRDQPTAPGLYSLSGPVLLTGNLVDTAGVFVGKRLVTDADGVAVELLYGDNLIARTLTARGSYRFTGLGPGGYKTRVSRLGVIVDQTATLTIARGDLVVGDTLRVPSVGDIYPVPNPVVTSTTLYFDVPDTEVVAVRIYDMAGNVVRTLHAGELLPGVRWLSWNANDIMGRPVSPGLYWATVVAGTDMRAQLLFK